MLSELNAAYLLPQLGKVDEINGRRREICARYERELAPAFARIDAQALKTPTFNRPTRTCTPSFSHPWKSATRSSRT